MYIGKVEVGNEWEKLDTLIKAQVDGQSSFAFDAATTYQLQGEGSAGVCLCETEQAPSDKSDGFVIRGTQCANYKPTSGLHLWVKVAEYPMSALALLKIATLGE